MGLTFCAYAACLSDAGLFGLLFFHKSREEESRRCSFYKFKEVIAFSGILCKITCPLEHIHNLHMFSQQGKIYTQSAQNTAETERPLNNFSPGRVEDVFSDLRKHQSLSLLKVSVAGPWPGIGRSHTHCPLAVVPIQPLQACMLTPEGLTAFPAPSARQGTPAHIRGIPLLGAGAGTVPDC